MIWRRMLNPYPGASKNPPKPGSLITGSYIWLSKGAAFIASLRCNRPLPKLPPAETSGSLMAGRVITFFRKMMGTDSLPKTPYWPVVNATPAKGIDTQRIKRNEDMRAYCTVLL